MIEMIKKSYLNGKKISDDDIKLLNPIDSIISICPHMKQLVNDAGLLYKIGLNENMRTVKISYLKEFTPDYCIIRESTHDGTMVFVQDLLSKVISNIVDGSSYCKYNVPESYMDNLFNYDVHYTIGDIYYCSDFGIKNINNKKIQGQDDVMVLPVKISYIKNHKKQM